MAIGLGSLMETNSSPLASLPKDDACKPAGHHLNAATCLGVRGDAVARTLKHTGARATSSHHSSAGGLHPVLQPVLCRRTVTPVRKGRTSRVMPANAACETAGRGGDQGQELKEGLGKGARKPLGNGG